MAKKKAAKTVKPPKDKIDIQAATLAGDIRDSFLGILKDRGVWKKLEEAQQRDIAASAEHLAKEAIRRSSDIIAGRGFTSIHATLDQVVVKDGIKLVLKGPKDSPNIAELSSHQGQGVTVVLKDISRYVTTTSKPEIDKDEPALPGVPDEET